MVKKNLNAYLSGYADGEGCFCVTINKSKRHVFGWKIRTSFAVAQNRDRAEVLWMYKQRFGCGSIRSNRSDKTLKYEVRSVRDLVERVIPHFEKYPLLSSKRTDFEKFALVCKKMSCGEHLTKKGFREIVEVVFTINDGKRKYPKEAVKI